MRWSKIATLLLVLLLLSSVAQAKDIPAVSTVTVQGTGEMDVIPDQAMIKIGIVSNADTAEAAQTDNARLTTAVLQKLQSIDSVNQAKLRTASYGFSPVYGTDQDKNKPPLIIGYRASNTIMAVIEDPAQVGSVIDAALTSGANQISGIQFQEKDELQIKQAALQLAVKEAAAKAEAIAAAMDKHLGRVVEINEGGVSMQLPENDRFLLKASAAATPVLPGTIHMNASVTIVYELQ
ncbi:MAG: SIMPL domain-containing protein [Veillonellales bacterium]